MISKVSLRFGINTGISLLVTVAVVGGSLMIWYTYRMDGMIEHMVNRTVKSYQAASVLENSLLNQKGFLSYYIMDGNRKWLRQLYESRVLFMEKLSHAEALAAEEQEKSILSRLRKEFGQYVQHKENVLKLYGNGNTEEAQKVHNSSRTTFSHMMALSSDYKNHALERLKKQKDASLKDSRSLRTTAFGAAIIEVIAGLMIAGILFDRIISPLKDLVAKTDGDNKNRDIKNEIKKLSGNINALIRDSGKIHNELEKSQENLVMSEKLAMVGKLAAGMAHSVRNPLTSVKMRLFSLKRSLELSMDQAEDLQVISEEVHHIETIVQNFLEFSRPPRLQMQLLSPSSVVDMVLRLLSHRLTSYEVSVKLTRDHNLPEIEGDPEQLKEVLVNLMENACEAMGRGGEIHIRESVQEDDLSGHHAVVSIRDNGPGIPDSVSRKIFQPFFSTKDNGTGLGLSIARRVVKNHGGWLDISSKEGQGSELSIHLPVKE